jgi:hypothetical protein
MFIENKYKTWHDNIIANGKNRVLDCYKEKHHILPKSLGGNNKRSNLVELTAREHFIVHMLLCKFTEGKVNNKMVFAFSAMSFIKNKNRNYKATSRIAEKLKLRFIKILTGRKFSKETLAKLSKIRKGRKLTEEHKRKIGLAGVGRKQSQETILKRISKTTGMKRSQAFKDRMSEVASVRIFSEETRRKISLATKGNKYAIGFKHTQEAKDKIRQSNLGNKHTLGMICIYKDDKTVMVTKDKLQDYLNMGFLKGKLRRKQTNLADYG